MAKRDGSKIAAIHAGWRGTFSHITERVVRRFEEQGDRASDWVAAIGPSIGSCCYEVSEELIEQFVTRFDGYSRDQFIQGERLLDLPKLNLLELTRLGISEVEILPYCTRCSDQFYSYRREGPGVRQYSIIQRTSSILR